MQDVLQEQLAQTVFKALKEQGGHIYVCGDVTMAGDVLKTIQGIVRQQGQLSVEEAGAFISKLRVSSVRPTARPPAKGTAPAASSCRPGSAQETGAGGGSRLPPTLPAPGQGRERDLPELWKSLRSAGALCSRLQPPQPARGSHHEPAAVLSTGTSSLGHPL